MADHEPMTGTGLGLPIARELARAMGGELDVASLSGIGSSFVLVLPGPAGATAGGGDGRRHRTAVAFETEHLRTLGPCAPGRCRRGGPRRARRPPGRSRRPTDRHVATTHVATTG